MGRREEGEGSGKDTRAQALQTTWGWPGNIFSVACKKTGARLRLARQGQAVVIRPVASSLVTGSSHSENRVMGSLISVRSRHQVKKTKAETTIKKKKSKAYSITEPRSPCGTRRAPRAPLAFCGIPFASCLGVSLSQCVCLSVFTLSSPFERGPHLAHHCRAISRGAPFIFAVADVSIYPLALAEWRHQRYCNDDCTRRMTA